MRLIARLATIILLAIASVAAASAPPADAGTRPRATETSRNETPSGPVAVGSLATGSYHTCAIVGGGQVRCWGVNFSGQLGLGDTVNRGDGQGEMGGNLPAVDLGAGRSATAVAAGAFHTCALLDDATVKCWGSNSQGQLGQGDTARRGSGPGQMGDNLPPVNLGAGRTATAIAAGGQHTCAVLDNGAVKCWGRNLAGQLGLGDTAARGDGPGEMGDNLPIVPLGAGRTAIAIATAGNFDFGITFNPGLSHTCALLDNGTVKCWGLNGGGQLGLGDTVTRGDGPGEMGDNLPAVQLGTGRTATALSLGWGHNCAVLDDGSVKCWGGNSYGQLGQGDTASRGDGPGEMGDNLPTIDLGTGRTATAITAGDSHTCALLDDHTVKCWGRSDLGQLGRGDTVTRGNGPGEMGDALPVVDLGPGRTATAIAAQGGWTTGEGDVLVHDGSHTCARLDDGTVKCWGANGYGQLGLGNTTTHGDGPGEMGDRLPPADLGTGVLGVALSADAQRVWAGEAIGYQLTITNLGAAPLTDLSVADADAPACEQPVPDLAVGEHHDIACSYVTPDTAFGPYTNTAIVDAAEAGPVESGPAAVYIERAHPRLSESIVVGGSRSCALLNGGAVKCWGVNDIGQLGLGDTSNRGDGTGEMGDNLPIIDLGTGRTATAISAGGAHTCALLDDGGVKCWGNNSQGQLGLGNTAARGDDPGEMGDNLPAIDLGTGRTATAVSAGGSHTCAVLDDGSVRCWGENASGQLGLGTTRRYGDNQGEMGDNLPTVQLGTGRTAVAISAGDSHTCVLLDDGSLKCWGENGSGRLGLGTEVDQGKNANEMGDNLAPVSLGTGRTATAVSAGGRHTCALLDDGSLKCWGLNDLGQLGQGSNITRGDGPGEMGDNLTAVDLGTGRTAVGVTAAWQHTCAPLDDGSLKCWGYNFYGQLGLGDTARRGHVAGGMGDALPAVAVGSDRTTTSAAGGERHTCALLDDRTVRCWGSNGLGQLGYGDGLARGDAPGEMGDSLRVVDLGAAPSPGSVTGTVTESGSGTPLGGAMVAVLATSDLGFVAGERAGPDGTYDLVVPAGDYHVFALDPAGVHTPGYVGSGTPDVIHVDPGAAAVADPQLHPTRGQVAGTITDATEHSPVGSGLFVAVDGASGRPGRGALTAGSGAYRATHVMAGAHLGVFVDLAGTHTPEFHDDRSDPSTADLFHVSAGATTSLDADLSPRAPPAGSAHLTGTVTSSSGQTPLAGIAVIALRAADYQITAGDLTDSDGNYDIAVDPGDHKLEFYDPAAIHQMSWHPNLAYHDIAQAGTVTASTAAPTITDATLTPAVASISGRVRDTATNNAIADAWVIAINTDGAVTAATITNPTGHYALAYLPPGTYRLRILDPTNAHTAGYYDHAAAYATATPLTVAAGQNLTDRNTTLDPTP